MSVIRTSILSTIGKTPVVRINHLAPEGIEMFVKIEAFNPLGSVKDRIALGIIEAAERDGRLKPGQTVVEATSGNTGIGLAMVCAQKGYPLVIVMSESFSVERRRLLRFLGAKVVLTPAASKGSGKLMAVTFNLDKAKEFSAMDGEGFGSGASIAVQGVGPMGLLHVFKARIMGAGDIIVLDRSDFRLAMALKFGADHAINITGMADAEIIARVRDLTEGRGADVALECTGYPEAVMQGVQMVRRGGMYIVAGVFADVGPITLNPHHIAARQVRIVGMCNHPSRGYPASMKLLEKFKDIFPLRDFVTHQFKVEDAVTAMAQVQDLNSCMKVVIAP